MSTGIYRCVPSFSVIVIQLQSPLPSTIFSCGLLFVSEPGNCFRSPRISDAVEIRVSVLSIWGMWAISCFISMVSSAFPFSSTGWRQRVRSVRWLIAADPVADLTGVPCSLSLGPCWVSSLEPVKDDDAPESSIDKCVNGVLSSLFFIIKHDSLPNIVSCMGSQSNFSRMKDGGVIGPGFAIVMAMSVDFSVLSTFDTD